MPSIFLSETLDVFGFRGMFLWTLMLPRKTNNLRHGSYLENLIFSERGVGIHSAFAYVVSTYCYGFEVTGPSVHLGMVPNI